jgi:hypothetical protein
MSASPQIRPNEPGTTTAGHPGRGLRQGLPVAAVLTVLSLGFQYVTAGELFPQGGPEQVHAAGAVALHVLSGLTAVAAVLLWRRGGVPARTAVLGVVVFVLTFVQAATGGRSTLWLHVPGAMVLTVGAVWLAVWTHHAGEPHGSLSVGAVPALASSESAHPRAQAHLEDRDGNTPDRPRGG